MLQTIPRRVTLIKYLANLGYGTRREVTALVAARRVTRADGTALGVGDAFSHADLRVHGQPPDPAPGVVLLLNKPVGYVCSTRDVPPLVYDLLPARFLKRSPIIAPVGRLDRDTSGLLLLTDDGQLNHRLTSPRAHVPKTYRATLATDVSQTDVVRFESGGLLLEGESAALAPASMTVVTPRTIEITISEGRYHQVRRMFAAVENHVVTLKRVAIGALPLGDIADGRWRALTDAERELLRP